MASTSLRTNYRPLRVGICVNENNITEVLEAVKLNTLLWGGIYNPIIPVKNGELAQSIIDEFNIDFLYAQNRQTEIVQFIDKQEHLKWHFHLDGTVVRNVGGKNYIGILDIAHNIDYYWEKHFKNNDEGNFVRPLWKDDDPLFNVFAVEFGLFPDESVFEAKYENAYMKGLKAESVKILKTRKVKKSLYQQIPPITMTELRLDIMGGPSSTNTFGIYFGNPSIAMDLIEFWNLRASGKQVIFVPLDNHTRLSEYVAEHSERCREALSSMRFSYGISLWYSEGTDENRIKELAKELLPDDLHKSYSVVSKDSWDNRPVEVKFETKTLVCSVDESYGKPKITAQLPDMPTKKLNYLKKQGLAIDITSYGNYEYRKHTLKLPYLPKLNKWFGYTLSYEYDAVRVQMDGFSLIIDTSDEMVGIYPIQTTELIKRVFEEAKIKTQRSTAGVIAQKIIEKMGDLDDCRFLKITGVRELIKMPSKSSIKWSKALNIIGTHSFKKFKGLYITARDEQHLNASSVWEYLIEKVIFVPNVSLYNSLFSKPTNYKCPNCELRSSISIKEFEGKWVCPYCDEEMYMPTEINKYFSKKNQRKSFNFKKTGLFAKDNNQEGAIPVILTLLQLSRRSMLNNLAYDTSTKLLIESSGVKCETDFIVLDSKSDFDSIPTFIIGECKTNDEITQADIDNNLKIKEALRKIGIKTYLVFSKLADFTPDEIQRFKDLVNKGVQPILFTSTELEPYEPYEHYWNNNIKLPDTYTHSPEGMARNSYEIYLK